MLPIIINEIIIEIIAPLDITLILCVLLLTYKSSVLRTKLMTKGIEISKEVDGYSISQVQILQHPISIYSPKIRTLKKCCNPNL